MWKAALVIRLFAKNLGRIAVSLEQIAALYRTDLQSRGVILTDATIQDELEVVYGYQEPDPE